MVLVARLVLLGVLLVAAAAKLRDRDGSRRAVVGFGAPPALAAPIVLGLAAAELATALALVVAPSTGGWVAAALLGALAVVVAVVLVTGRRPECHCFGRLPRGRIGWPTVARNVGLVGVALIVCMDASLLGWPVAIAMIGLATWAIASRPRAREAEPSPLDGLRRPGVPTVAVFSAPQFGPCQAVAPKLERLHRDHADQVTLVIVSNGTPVAADASGPTVVTDERGILFGQFGVEATPTAIRVDSGEAAVGEEAILTMIDDAIAISSPVLSRRGMLGRVAQGMVSLTALPALAAACSTDSNKGSSGSSGTAAATGATAAGRTQLKVDGAYLCNQPFALCTTAPCTPSASDPTIANCECVVMNTWSVGLKSCEERATKGQTLYSDFATANVTQGFAILACPENARWANCVDVRCTQDTYNPAKAVCACQLVEQGPSFTFGGGCDTAQCTETIWSGANPASSLNAPFSKGVQQLGVAVMIPPACPTGSSGSTGTAGATPTTTTRTTR